MTETNRINDFLTATEAAQVLGVSDATVRNRIADESLQARKHGREWRIPQSEVERIKTLMDEDGEWFAPKKPKAPNETKEETKNTERNESSLQWEVEMLWVKLEAAERENSHLGKESENLHQQIIEQSHSIRSLTEQNERLTLLLANEQAYRMKALPRPIGWIRKLFGRQAEV